MKKLIKYNELFRTHRTKMIKKFENFVFREIEKSKKDKMYLVIEYVGGDADIYINRSIEMPSVKFSTYKDQLEDINEYILIYKTLMKIINKDNMKSNIMKSIRHQYNGVLSKFGEDLMEAYENVPSDPSGGDGDYNCSISNIRLIGYDEEGNKHESRIK